MQDFEELQTAWANENQDDMYAINHQALGEIIRRKKAGAGRFSDLTEKVLIIVNLFIGGGLLVLSIVKGKNSWGNYTIIAIILALAAYVIYVRMQRLRASETFDRSLAGDVDQAISDTQHRVRISKAGLLYIPVIAGGSLLALWVEHKPLWMIGLFAAFFSLAVLAGRWEHKNWHQGRLDELQRLREQLQESETK